MCVISLYCEKSKDTPTLNDLKKMENVHTHGGGIAWIDNGFVNFRKGINLNSKEIMKLIKVHKIKTPFVVHFRIKSSGSVCDKSNCNFKQNNKKHNCSCHGFLIDELGLNDQSGKTKQSILFHNGTISEDLLDIDIKQVCLNKKIDLPSFVSDSHKIAFLVAHYGDRYIMDFVEKSEKFAILSPKELTFYNGFQNDSNDNLVSNDWHDDTYDYNFLRGNKQNMYNQKDCKNIDCLEHDYESEECLILDNSKYYKVNKNGQYRDLDFYDQEYDDLLFKDRIDSRRFEF